MFFYILQSLGLFTLGFGIAAGVGLFFIAEPMTRRILREQQAIIDREANAYELKYFADLDRAMAYNEEHGNDEYGFSSEDEDDDEDEEARKHALQYKDGAPKNLYNKTVHEQLPTPYGEVIMCYDDVTESFAYYCDKSWVPYRYLETVARKYVLTHHCIPLYVDIREEYEKAVARMEAAKLQKEKGQGQGQGPTKGGKGGVFAALKPYNRKSATIKKKELFTEEELAAEAEAVLLDGASTNRVLREKANRYSYRGKINDFDAHHAQFMGKWRRGIPTTDDKIKPVFCDNTNEVMSYAEYKRRTADRNALAQYLGIGGTTAPATQS